MKFLTNPENRYPLLKVYVYGLLVLSCVLFALQYAANLSMFRDEAALANNIVKYDYSGLSGILDNDQAAPIGFLLVTETVSRFLGTNEYALRLFPVVLALLSTIFFYLLVKEIDPRILVIAMALFVTSPLHMRYSAEFKQYIGDSFWSLLLLYLAMRFIRRPHRTDLMLLTVVGCVAVWFSHPVVFTLAGIGTTLLIHTLSRKNNSDVVPLIGMGSLWVISFVIVYFLHYRNAVSGTELSQGMNTYWQAHFLSFNLVSLIKTLVELFVWVGGVFQPALFILSIFGTIIGVMRSSKITNALLLSPALFMFMASLLMLYPVAQRLILFFIANLIILTAIGWWNVIHAIMRSNKRLGWAILLIVVLGILSRIQIPFTTTDTNQARQALAWIQSVDADAQLFVSDELTYLTTYYGYVWQPLTAQKPVGKYWLVLYDPPRDSEIPQTPHTKYLFLATTVLCISPQNDCPENVAGSSPQR